MRKRLAACAADMAMEAVFKFLSYATRTGALFRPLLTEALDNFLLAVDTKVKNATFKSKVINPHRTVAVRQRSCPESPACRPR